MECIPNKHPESIGKRARMKFEDEEGVGQCRYEGVVTSYFAITGKYGVYLPCDGQTEVYFDDNDMETMY